MVAPTRRRAQVLLMYAAGFVRDGPPLRRLADVPRAVRQMLNAEQVRLVRAFSQAIKLLHSGAPLADITRVILNLRSRHDFIARLLNAATLNKGPDDDESTSAVVDQIAGELQPEFFL